MSYEYFLQIYFKDELFRNQQENAFLKHYQYFYPILKHS